MIRAADVRSRAAFFYPSVDLLASPAARDGVAGLRIITLVLVLASALVLQGCGVTSPSKPSSPQKQAGASSAAQRPLTMEDLLRWPQQGTIGADKVISALHRTFKMKELQDSQFSSIEPVQLADGHVLSFAYVLERSAHIDIGVEQVPCVDPQWAATVARAILNPIYQDAHGVDRGRQYDAVHNGMSLNFNTTPVTYRCVTAIHIYPTVKPRP